jgi:hypothetical protein
MGISKYCMSTFTQLSTGPEFLRLRIACSGTLLAILGISCLQDGGILPQNCRLVQSDFLHPSQYILNPVGKQQTPNIVYLPERLFVSKYIKLPAQGCSSYGQTEDATFFFLNPSEKLPYSNPCSQYAAFCMTSMDITLMSK